MNKTQIVKLGEERRVFLRAPKKLSTDIFIKGEFDKRVYLNELSTVGLSFNIPYPEVVPNTFEMQFRPGLFSKKIRVQVEVKYRRKITGGFRVGCMYVDASDEDKSLIKSCVTRYFDISAIRRLVIVAAFLFSLDALWRILAYLLTFYYKGTELGKILLTVFPATFYGVMLVVYAAFSVTAVVLTKDVTYKSNKVNFFIGLFSLVPAFIFLATKNIAYWKLSLWNSGSFFITTFFGVQVFLVFYTGLAIVLALSSVKRIDLVFDSFARLNTNSSANNS